MTQTHPIFIEMTITVRNIEKVFTFLDIDTAIKLFDKNLISAN